MFVSNRFPLQAMSLRSFGWLLVGAAPNGSMVEPWWTVISSMAGWEITKKRRFIAFIAETIIVSMDRHWSTWGFSSHGADYQRVALSVLKLEARVPVGVQPAVWTLSLLYVADLLPGTNLPWSWVNSHLTTWNQKDIERRQKKLWASFGALLSRSLWWFPARNGSSTVWDVFFLPPRSQFPRLDFLFVAMHMLRNVGRWCFSSTKNT